MSLHQKATEYGITPSSRGENETLFHQIVVGQQAAKRLVEGNMAYVVNKAEKFLDEHTEFDFLKDDLISEGFLVLARIAKTVARSGDVQGEDFNPQGMLSNSLRNAFLDMIGNEREVPLTDAVTSTLTQNETALNDLRLDILSCCENKVEQQIIQLRYEGLVDHQIAALLGLSRIAVFRTRADLFSRFQKKIGKM